MLTLSNFLSDQFIYAIGWTIIHSLWQASFIALLMSFYLNQYKEEPSIVRYRIAITSLYIMFGVSIMTFLFYYSDSHITKTIIAYTSDSLTKISTFDTEASILQQANEILSNQFGFIITMWISGMIIFSMKFFGGLLWIQNLKHSGSVVESTSAHRILNELSESIGINKPIQLLESAKAYTPMMIGHIKPIILLPLGIVNKLELHEVEAILSHELSHIARNDFMQNIFQSLVEIIFYYHPAVWWISANIRAEREGCCDEEAVRQCGSAIHYAKTLVKVEELQHQGIPSLAIPMVRSKRQLLNRLQRILHQPQNKTQIREKLMATLLLFSFFTVFASDSPFIHEVFIEQERSNEIVGNDEPVKNLYVFESHDHIEKEHEEEIHDITQLSKSTFSSIDKIVIQMNDKEIQLDTVPEKLREIKKDKKSQIFKLKINDGVIEEFTIDDEKIKEKDIILKLAEKEKPRTFWDDEENKIPIQEMFENFVRDKEGLLSQLQQSNKWAEVFDEKGLLESIYSREIENDSKDIADLIHNFSKQNLLSNGFRFHDLSADFDVYKNSFKNSGNFDMPNSFHIQNNMFDAPVDKIFHALSKDGLIEDDSENSIEITGKYLKINGEKQPSNIWKKYKKLYEKHLGHELSKDSKIILRERTSSQNSFFNTRSYPNSVK